MELYTLTPRMAVPFEPSWNFETREMTSSRPLFLASLGPKFWHLLSPSRSNELVV